MPILQLRSARTAIADGEEARRQSSSAPGEITKDRRLIFDPIADTNEPVVMDLDEPIRLGITFGGLFRLNQSTQGW